MWYYEINGAMQTFDDKNPPHRSKWTNLRCFSSNAAD
jgi:hypothetical protein